MKNIFSAVFASLLFMSSMTFAVDAAAPISIKSAVAPVKSAAIQDAININTADAQTLTKLKGVGAKKAEAIIAWRKANGSFKTIEQFTEVKGIGAAILETNRKIIHL